MIASRAARAAFIAVACAAASVVAAQADPPVLKTVPKDGDVPYRAVVLVDDGTCPRGQIKEITGGSREKGVPRKVRCVPRPESLR